jgi:hypothetical protein
VTENNVIALSRFRADLSRSLSRRGKELLSAKDLPARVQALAPLEAYFIVKEIGVEDAVPLLVNATPEQLQTFVDLDCWNGDAPDATELDAWLAPFAAEGQETLARVFLGLEEELQILYLSQTLVIYDVRSEEPPETEEDVVRKTTVDTFFVIEPTPGEREVDPFYLVDALYKVSVEGTFQLLTAAKWEHSSEVEERALQFRDARLLEIGFPDRVESLRIFTPPPSRPNTTQQFVGGAEAVALPALYAAALGDSLLTRGLSRISDAHAVERLERDLVYLMNHAVMAYGGSPRDMTHVTEVAARVRDTLSLGLEVMLSPNGPLDGPESDAVAARAGDLLLVWPLVDIFRHGIATASELGAAAKKLAKDPVVAAWLDATETEHDDYSEARRDRQFVRALLARPPQDSGFDVGRPERRRAFSSRTDLAAATVRLETIRQRIT